MDELTYAYDLDDYAIEIENRIKNLMWTVSGDYNLKIVPDVEAYKVSKYIAFYNAIKQGGGVKYFDNDELSLYIVKKVFMSADEDTLVYISQLCLDVAMEAKLFSERHGVRQIKVKAYEDMLDAYFSKLSGNFLGRVKMAVIQDFLGYPVRLGIEEQKVYDLVMSLKNTDDTMGIIKTVDYIYNNYIDKDFERKHGGLEQILNVSLEELSEYNWQDFLNDEAYEDVLEKYIEQVRDSLTDINHTREEKNETDKQKKQSLLKVYDKEKDEKIFSYVELNYGKSYMSPAELKKKEYSICKGAHANCKLYYTEGVTRNPVKINYQYKYAKFLISNNFHAYHDKHRIVKKNIAVLTETLNRSIVYRNQKEEIMADSGKIVPPQLWKIGRIKNSKVFTKEIKKDNSEFVVEILMDASGSQSKKQDSVAIQGYIISEALSNAGIPHCVMGFCSFWNYTIMNRYRDFDDDAGANKRVLEYVASANNRDGLALRAAVDDLANRDEDNKILIVLSDGKPNDNTISREGIKTAKPYVGAMAIRDTAMEVRKIRSMGISVLGVFTGKEEDLEAEKKIYGKDFAYIRKIDNFSNIVSTYLKKQIIDM